MTKSPMDKAAKELRKHIKRWRANNPDGIAITELPPIDRSKLTPEELEFIEGHEAMSKKFKPTKVPKKMMHELLDRTYIIGDMFGSHIGSHIDRDDRFAALSPEIRSAIMDIDEKFGQLYQLIGQEHMK